MTIVIHLRNGRRLVREGEAVRRICFPVLRPADGGPAFGREFYKLLDVREVDGSEVATYVYDDTPEPELGTVAFAPPTRWERFLKWIHRVMDL